MEKGGLVRPAKLFLFDLVKSKGSRLVPSDVSYAVIRPSLEAMQKQVAGMENPLREAAPIRVDAASP